MTLRRFDRGDVFVYLFAVVVLVSFVKDLVRVDIQGLVTKYFLIGLAIAIMLHLFPDKIKKLRFRVYFRMVLGWFPALFIEEVHQWIFDNNGDEG